MNLYFQPDVYAEFAPQTYAGMGTLDPESQTIAGIAATGATTTASILVSLSIIGGPWGAAIAGIAAIGVAIANLFSGCGQTCVAATQIANQAEPLLSQNLDHYLSVPVRYRSMQLAALNNFDTVWAALTKSCGAPGLQDAGQRCISDRQRGACAIHSTVEAQWIQGAGGTWTWQPGGPATDNGPCWNWFKGYRDPIANDPTVQPDPVAADSVTGVLDSIFGTGSGATGGVNVMPLLLIGGATIAALALVKD